MDRDRLLSAQRERQRTEFLLTLNDARASLSRGEGLVITEESMRQLAQEVKERGRARLLAEFTRSRESFVQTANF